MGFFADDVMPFASKKPNLETSLDLLHSLSCKICPRNHLDICSPKMNATGSDTPDILILGESPGREEDRQNKQFVGKSGEYLRPLLEKGYRYRFLNTVNCFNDNITPEFAEIEACRPRLIADIERTKPKAIFGFGHIPLQWALGESMITNWRGRRTPIIVGKHKCWYYPFFHPAHIIRQADEKPHWIDMPEDERSFKLDLARAFEDMKRDEAPDPHDKKRAMLGVEVIEKCTHEDALLVCEFLKWASIEPTSGIDIETPPVRPYVLQACILTAAVSAAGSTLAFPIDHPGAKWAPDDKAMVVAAFKAYLRSRSGRKAVHSLGFELEYFGVLYGIEYVRAGTFDDTMSQAFVLDQRGGGKGRGSEEDEGSLECFSLGFLTKVYFGQNIKKLSNVNRENLADTPLHLVLPYNGIDAKYHRETLLKQDDLLEREGLTHVYQDHLRRIATVTLTQIKGVPVDREFAHKLAIKYDTEIEKLKADIQKTATAKLYFQRYGRYLTPSSNPELIVVCRDLLKSKAGERRNGKYAVDEETLKQIKDPLMPLIIKYRHATKIRSTYVFDTVFEFDGRRGNGAVLWPDGQLHQRLNTTIARTARLSSADPNLQNQQKRTKEGKETRRQIKAKPGYVFLSADYGQIQPRIFAMVSHDRRFMKQLWEGYDTHGEWARRIVAEIPRLANKNDKDEMKALRQKTKSDWVLAIFFGSRLDAAARRFGCEENEMKRLYEQFQKEFEGIFAWQEENNKFYLRHGYVEFLTGRRRCGPLSYNDRCNTPIQMGEAEITLDGANRISEMGIWDLQPNILVHDDNVLHIPANKVEEYSEILVKEMVRPDIFDFINVPIVVELSVGDDWCDMHDGGVFSSPEFYPKEMHRGLQLGEI